MRRTLQEYNPPCDPLKILHKDERLLVLSKPSGLLSVPGKAEHLTDCLRERAIAEYPDALLVHRLDMDTSGIFLMARDKKAQGHLGKQFEGRHVKKTYIADIWGSPKDDSGLIDLPIRCDWDNRPLQMICFEHGRPAQTKWKVMERFENHTRVKLEPLTGRSHQLRVHMLELEKEKGGHPILGDSFYAHDEAFNAAPRLHLHASALTFYHPETQEIITIEDEVEF
jgi:tRNA pseudouridine32 synthase/23S rRNA pseudouridine746 synthase